MPRLFNDTGQRIEQFDAQLRMPASVLTHWSGVIMGEKRILDDPRYRYFTTNEKDRGGAIQPKSERVLWQLQYCGACGVNAEQGINAVVEQSIVEAKVWVNGDEYVDQKTILELASAD